jgi:hypothetical protein
MAEAIKTLQRALEDPRLSTRRTSVQLNEGLQFDLDPSYTRILPSPLGSIGEAAIEVDDGLTHREFMEEGVSALRRMSGDRDQSLPAVCVPWQIQGFAIAKSLLFFSGRSRSGR